MVEQPLRARTWSRNTGAGKSQQGPAKLSKTRIENDSTVLLLSGEQEFRFLAPNDHAFP
jgi:hypothetical protein